MSHDIVDVLFLRAPLAAAMVCGQSCPCSDCGRRAGGGPLSQAQQSALVGQLVGDLERELERLERERDEVERLAVLDPFDWLDIDDRAAATNELIRQLEIMASSTVPSLVADGRHDQAIELVRNSVRAASTVSVKNDLTQDIKDTAKNVKSDLDAFLENTATIVKFGVIGLIFLKAIQLLR